MPRTNTHESALAELAEGFDRFSRDQAGRLDDIGAEVDRLNARLAAAAVPGGGLRGNAAAIAALGGFGKTGTPQAAMSVGSLPDGGVIVAPELDAEIIDRMPDESPIRALAEVIETHSVSYERVISTSGPASGWVAEAAARPATGSPGLAKVAIPAGEIYANVPVTQKLLDDAEADIGKYLLGAIATEFARNEGAAFVAGDGTDKPMGFLAYPRATTSDATRAHATLQTVASGAAAAVTADGLLALLYALRAPYRRNATWLMASSTARAVMGLKDGDGRFLWIDGLAAGQPPTLLGRPVAFDENMPVVAAGAAAIALGDWRKGYLVTDRKGLTLLRDPFTNKPYVNFYATKRTGGAVIDDDAIKLQLIAAS